MSRKATLRLLKVFGRRGERGFALLEILVAFVILALGLGAISVGVATAMRSDGRTQTQRDAIRLAQSRLEAEGVSRMLVPGRREGRIASNYKWREVVTAADIKAEPPVLPDVKAGQATVGGGVAAFWVEMTVQAPDGTAVKLGVLKLAPETQQ